jgi:hypothetical protein
MARRYRADAKRFLLPKDIVAGYMKERPYTEVPNSTSEFFNASPIKNYFSSDYIDLAYWRQNLH